jgi:hypothetical protein
VLNEIRKQTQTVNNSRIRKEGITAYTPREAEENHEIQTEHILSTSLGYYHNTKLLGDDLHKCKFKICESSWSDLNNEIWV